MSSGGRWTAITAALVLLGSLGAVQGAALIGRRDEQRARLAFQQTSSDIAAALRVAIEREADLTVSGAAFFLDNPDATAAELREWAASVRALERYPELVGLGEVVLVPKDQVPAYADALAADPSGALANAGSFELTPPSNRDVVCLLRVGVSRDPDATGAPPGFDYCAGTDGSLTLSARDTGRSGYRAVDTGSGQNLAVQVPFYRGGSVPVTVEARRGAFAGWMGMAFDPNVVLASALADHAGAIVEFRFHDRSADVTFASTTVPDDAESILVDLHDGWSVRTFQVPFDGSVLGDHSARALLVAGVSAGLLLGLFVFVLGTSRSRAMRLVEEQTAELRHRALHDPLTDLPNRALVMDRAEHLLARNRRAGTSPAALFVDLDGFKNVNDTLGHEAGDRLLVEVAGRLASVLRDADTVGRMGGDEFVVLLDGVEPAESPEVVADRMLDVMRQPFDLEGAPMPAFVHTSIGIAVGDRPTGSDLLRDADLALYEAKATGKDRSVVFQPEMQATIARRMQLEFHLRAALEDGQFHVSYEPVYDRGGNRIGSEAQVRWMPPGLGEIGMDEMLPILDQTGRLRDVSRWMLGASCHEAAGWRATGNDVSLVVNLSSRQLESETIVDDIVEALSLTGLEPSALIVEISEKTLGRNLLNIAHRLRAIHDLGVRVAVEAVGTEHSTLGYLRELPIDWRIVDRRLISSTNR